MLRKNIGKNQKNSVEKKNNSGLVLPKSLWKFYFKYAVSGSTFSLVAWAISFFIVAMDGVLFPNFQRWFVALFENPVPAGQTFMQYAFPIVACVVMGWYVKYIQDNYRKDISDISTRHKEEMDKVTQALNNNTLAIQRLTDYIEKDNDKRD